MGVNELVLALLAAQVALQAGIFLTLGGLKTKVAILWEAYLNERKSKHVQV